MGLRVKLNINNIESNYLRSPQVLNISVRQDFRHRYKKRWLNCTIRQADQRCPEKSVLSKAVKS